MRACCLVVLLCGCSQGPLSLEVGPVAWSYDPALPSTLHVQMDAGLSSEAGPWARIDNLPTEATITFEEGAPERMIVTDVNGTVEVDAGAAVFDVGFGAIGSPSSITSGGRVAPVEGTGPFEATVEVRTGLDGRWRRPEDVWVELGATVVPDSR